MFTSLNNHPARRNRHCGWLLHRRESPNSSLIEIFNGKSVLTPENPLARQTGPFSFFLARPLMASTDSFFLLAEYRRGREREGERADASFGCGISRDKMSAALVLPSYSLLTRVIIEQRQYQPPGLVNDYGFML